MEGKASDWRPGPTVCRCCLTEGCYKDISTEYFWMGKREVYSEMLKETLDVSIGFSKSGGPNSNSRLICEPCISRLRDASEFKRQVMDCEKTFMHHLDPGTSSSSSSKAQELAVDTIGEVKMELVKHEKESLSDDDFDDRPDFLDVDSDDDLDDQPLTKLATKIPKKESVSLLDLLDTSQITVKRKSTLKLKTPPKKIVKKKEVVKPSASKAAPVKQTEKKKGTHVAPNKTQENDIFTQNDTETMAAMIQIKYDDESEVSQQSVLTLLACSRVCPFKWMPLKASKYFCIYCDQQFADPAELRRHNSEHENLPLKEIQKAIAYYVPKILLQVDITDVSCKLCDVGIYIDTLEDLITHLSDEHDQIIQPISDLAILPFKLSQGDYRCSICCFQFEGFQPLKHHMISTHYANYICDQCGSGFITQEALKNHASTHDLEPDLVTCDTCGKVFNSYFHLRVHCNSVHLKLKNFSCPHCPEKFVYRTEKINHVYRVHKVQVEPYKCKLCPKVFKFKGKRDVHFRAFHLKQRPYACNECDVKFFDKGGLLRHMFIHSAEDYRCTVCHKIYRRPDYLKLHMKTHHVTDTQ